METLHVIHLLKVPCKSLLEPKQLWQKQDECMALPCPSSKYEKGVKASSIPSTICSTYDESPGGC